MTRFPLMLLMLITFQWLFAQESPKTNTSGNKSEETNISGEPQINWITFQEAIEKNKKKPRKIFIDVYTDWCGWCKVMDKQTFSDPLIIQYINKNFYAVKLDGEFKESISFKGKEYTFVSQGRGYHQLAQELMNGRMSYPTVVFLDEKMDLLQPIPGFRKAAELDIMLKYFGGDHYKSTSYDIFQQKYQSPYPQE